MRPGGAADHSPPSSAAVMEEYSYTSTNPLGHTGPVTGSLYLFNHIQRSTKTDDPLLDQRLNSPPVRSMNFYFPRSESLV